MDKMIDIVDSTSVLIIQSEEEKLEIWKVIKFTQDILDWTNNPYEEYWLDSSWLINVDGSNDYHEGYGHPLLENIESNKARVKRIENNVNTSIEDINWNEYLVELGIEFENFKEVVTDETHRSWWKIKNYSKKSDIWLGYDFTKLKWTNIDFLHNFLNFYNFWEKYDLRYLWDFEFENIQLIEWKISGSLLFSYENSVIKEKIKFVDNLIIKWTNIYSDSLEHIDYEWDIISYEDDTKKSFLARLYFWREEDLKIYFKWKKILNHLVDYFEFSDYKSDGWWIPINRQTYTFNKNKFILALENWEIELEDNEILEYDLWVF